MGPDQSAETLAPKCKKNESVEIKKNCFFSFSIVLITTFTILTIIPFLTWPNLLMLMTLNWTIHFPISNFLKII